MKRITTPQTITNQIADALAMPDLNSGPGRRAAVAEIVSSFVNYTEKHDKGQQGFFAGMIIRILLPNDKSVHFSDMQTVINIIQKGDEAIQEEIKNERDEWLAARKADKELALA
jgi:hemerythrin